MFPASQPINKAPGINIFGKLCNPPSIKARAPYEILFPPSIIFLIEAEF